MGGFQKTARHFNRIDQPNRAVPPKPISDNFRKSAIFLTKPLWVLKLKILNDHISEKGIDIQHPTDPYSQNLILRGVLSPVRSPYFVYLPRYRPKLDFFKKVEKTPISRNRYPLFSNRWFHRIERGPFRGGRALV